MSGWLNHNGSLITSGSAIFSADSRAFRYGDGIFETMKVADGVIRLWELHYKRLLKGIGVLKLDFHPSAGHLQQEIFRTIARNGIDGPARIRLAAFRGNGGLYETNGPGGGYLIQVWPMDTSGVLNSNGLVIGVYEDARKSCDVLANIKSNNYLPYVLAALHASERKWNDSLVLNAHGRVCDATIANVFWARADRIFTVPLSEGCVAGVMRQHLLDTLPANGWEVVEQPVTVEELMTADEIFLTNATNGIRWVKEFNNVSFGNRVASQVFRSTF